jgi:hypothetical protein
MQLNYQTVKVAIKQPVIVTIKEIISMKMQHIMRFVCNHYCSVCVLLIDELLFSLHLEYKVR